MALKGNWTHLEAKLGSKTILGKTGDLWMYQECPPLS